MNLSRLDLKFKQRLKISIMIRQPDMGMILKSQQRHSTDQYGYCKASAVLLNGNLRFLLTMQTVIMLVSVSCTGDEDGNDEGKYYAC
jgi:hypothetical protein